MFALVLGGRKKSRIGTKRVCVCATVGDAVHKVYVLLCLVVFCRMQDPAANKWLSVWPVANNLALMQSFHGVFVFALRYACDVQSGEEDDLGAALHVSDDELMGSLAKEAWHRRERRRELRALIWVELGSSHFLLCVFSFVGGLVMHLHFLFFKSAQTSKYGSERGLIFDLCSGASESPVQKVLAALWALLNTSTAWSPLESVFGAFQTWPPERQSIAKEVVQISIAEVTRRVSQPLSRPPFTYWTRISDPRRSVEERRQSAVELFEADERTLDGSSVKLRRRTKNPEALMAPFWQAFIFHAMNKVPLASAIVECLFAHFKQWQMASAKPMAPALLSAKHLLHESQKILERKQQRETPISPTVGTRPKKKQSLRPAWIMKTGDCSKRNARHEYMSEFVRNRPAGQQTQDAFRAASQGWKHARADRVVKRGFSARAKRNNMLGRAQKTAAIINEGLGVRDDDGTALWGRKCGKYPLLTDDIRGLLTKVGGMSAESLRWSEVAGTVVDPSLNFPGTVRYRPVREASLLAVGIAAQSGINEIVLALKVVLGAKGLETSRSKKRIPFTKLLCIVDHSSRTSTFIMPSSVQKTPTFECWFLRYAPIGTDILWHQTQPPFVAVAVANAGVTSSAAIGIEVREQGPGPYTYHLVHVEHKCGADDPRGALHIIDRGEPIDLDKLSADQREKAFHDGDNVQGF